MVTAAAELFDFRVVSTVFEVSKLGLVASLPQLRPKALISNGRGPVFCDHTVMAESSELAVALTSADGLS
jgi:hypothetical protein